MQAHRVTASGLVPRPRLPAASPNPSLALAEVGGIAELTEAADCWSFGSLLYELLTGVVRSGGAMQYWDGGTEGTPQCKNSCSGNAFQHWPHAAVFRECGSQCPVS